MDSMTNRVRSSAADRRVEHRYLIDGELEYKVIHHNQVVGAGYGRAINASGSGILFESLGPLPPDMYIELSIAWPGRPGQRVAVRLRATGQTVRSQGRYTAVAIHDHAYRASATGMDDRKQLSMRS